jgi:hypothetical protein
MVGVEVAGNTYFLTWDTQLEWDQQDIGGDIPLNAAPPGANGGATHDWR